MMQKGTETQERPVIFVMFYWKEPAFCDPEITFECDALGKAHMQKTQLLRPYIAKCNRGERAQDAFVINSFVFILVQRFKNGCQLVQTPSGQLAWGKNADSPTVCIFRLANVYPVCIHPWQFGHFAHQGNFGPLCQSKAKVQKSQHRKGSQILLLGYVFHIHVYHVCM